MRRVLSCLAIVIALASFGCGSDKGPKKYKVTGPVSFDGQPVAKGSILFRSTGAEARGYTAEIQDGKYEIECEDGSMRVEITASREVPGKTRKDENTGETVPFVEMYIPAKYNSNSTLTATVKTETQTIPFELAK